VKTLVAYKSGRVLADVVENVSGALVMYAEAKALEDLRSLPNWKNVPEGAKDPDGLWIGFQENHWCISYNTKFVSREDLPKRWEDLLTNPRWRGGSKGRDLGERIS
jgi:ABC-type Fe3+ transport system substrate-binding protein